MKHFDFTKSAAQLDDWLAKAEADAAAREAAARTAGTGQRREFSLKDGPPRSPARAPGVGRRRLVLDQNGRDDGGYGYG